jgi:hypothetical protein
MFHSCSELNPLISSSYGATDERHRAFVGAPCGLHETVSRWDGRRRRLLITPYTDADHGFHVVFIALQKAVPPRHARQLVDW